MPVRLQFLTRVDVAGPWHSVSCIAISLLMLLTTANCEVKAEPTDPLESEQIGSDPIAVDRRAMNQLRSGELRQALETLSPLGERTPTLSIQGREAYSEVCGALFRSLSQLSSEEQYDLLLAWTFPSDGVPRVRLLSAIVPQTAPPAEFARLLGERPRKTSFPIAAIGDVRGLYSTGTHLAAVASDCGRLQPLIRHLESLAEKSVPRAEVLLALARFLEPRADLRQATETLNARIQKTQKENLSRSPIVGIWEDDLILATAALQYPSLSGLGTQLLEAILDSTRDQPSPVLRPFLRRAHAVAVLKSDSQTDTDAVLNPSFLHWVPASGGLGGDHRLDGTSGVWLAHEQQLLHLCGAETDKLYLKYPISDGASFLFETQVTGPTGTVAGVAFDGMTFQALDRSAEFLVSDTDGKSLHRVDCPFADRGGRSNTNRMSITWTQMETSVAVNHHPYWKTEVKSSSPWVGLYSSGDGRPLFRNLKLNERPTIPREVPLIVGSDLHGWRMRSLADPRATEINGNRPYTVEQDTIRLAKSDVSSLAGHIEQTLVYDRPMVDGDTVRYEFYYEPESGATGVMLGRVAFLWEPDTVRLHWVTSGPLDWTTLPDNNSITEPQNRRGPRPISLKVNDWNRAAISLKGQIATLVLNDVTVYQRTVDWTSDDRFGIYRANSTADTRIRNVFLSGDWPESLPEQLGENPFASNAPTSRSIGHSLNRLIGESNLADNVLAVRSVAAERFIVDRFEILSQWILPGEDHPGIRMVGAFVARGPLPELDPNDVEPSVVGGRIVSPVFDWLEAAHELGQIEECRKRLSLIEPSDESLQQRARVALSILLAIENDEQPSETDLKSFLDLIKASNPTENSAQWPELLVADQLVRRCSDEDLALDFVSFLQTQRMARNLTAESELWNAHVVSLLGMARLRKVEHVIGANRAKRESRDWISTTATTSATSGQGYPDSNWWIHGQHASKVTGQENDLLYFRLPLSGDFDLECDIIGPTVNPTSIMIGGHFASIHDNLKSLEVGSLRSSPVRLPIEPPVTHIGKSMHYRSEIRDSVQKTFLNGRFVHSETLPKKRDPWVALRSRGRHLSRVEDVCILGSPVVVDAVALSEISDLAGWIDYHKEASTGDRGGWEQIDDATSGGMIVGHSNLSLKGQLAESLLRYQRPLNENGVVDYEFFYDPGRSEAHPALDRIAFLLRPEGICEHCITDGRYERSELMPDNKSTLQDCRRGPARLPLMAGTWNGLKMILDDQTLQIELNGQLVYERRLESTNQRLVGLFHYVDHGEARVRRMSLRGDWPRIVPSVEKQELAKNLTVSLNRDASRMPAAFTHDFGKNGVPSQYFRTPPPLKGVSISAEPNGLHIQQTNLSGWLTTEHSARFSLSGDFDVEAVFERGQFRDTKVHTGIMLKMTLEGPDQPVLQFYRMVDELKRHLTQSAIALLQSDKVNRSWIAKDTANCSEGGCLRMARRGDRLYYLFADENSDHFQLVDEQAISRADVLPESVLLVVYCHDAGTTNVVWKKLSMRAERMKWFPDASEPLPTTLSILSADGTEFKTVTMPKTRGFGSVGSPQWSSDGRKIGVDMSGGDTSDSRIVVVNVADSEVTDLGRGCMPSFSKDGTQITFSDPGRGIVMMNADGTDRQVLDGQGWGTQWSPDGRWIAYAKSGNITLYDVATKRSKALLTGGAAKRYPYVYWNLCWSHDSKSIAFRGRSLGTKMDEFAVVDLNRPDEIEVVCDDAADFSVAITWSPDNQDIIVTREIKPGQGPRLHAINRRDPGPPKYFAPQRSDEKAFSFSWSHDGKWIAIAGQRHPGPVEWKTVQQMP